ncbi:YcjF family protein [Labilibaculum antarcticum]|uniref:G domain-containing protein n=1 Tax=Labilibaculum antarcticum TaxID=1717717 RepID=A0A1Y1CQ29_9BACT|nr:GTPase [Labilibaculum antarcticum]BAX82364.1 hypothetical protein ALGA_4073 [Labilibaculum antarcticum]
MFAEKDTDRLKDQFEKEFKDFKRNIKKPNILILGGTGVGKSTLINMVFGDDTVKTGEGKPITKGINRIAPENKDIVLYDTEGFELGDENNTKFKNEIIGFVKERQNEPLENQIHIVWQVIAASSNRVTDYDKELNKVIKDLGIPIAVIFSKCDEVSMDDTEKSVKELFEFSSFDQIFQSAESPFFATTVQEMQESEDNLNVSKIVNWSIGQLPDMLVDGFVAAQVSNLSAKRNKADSIILQHSGANALVGFSPIPFSDAPILITSQTGMLVRILYVYGMGDAKSIAKGIMTTSGTSIVISNLGKSIVGNLLKCIPGVGTAVGGAINAGVASAITYAMGKASSELTYQFLKSNLSKHTDVIGDFAKLFNDNFEQLFKTYYKKNQ